MKSSILEASPRRLLRSLTWCEFYIYLGREPRPAALNLPFDKIFVHLNFLARGSADCKRGHLRQQVNWPLVFGTPRIRAQLTKGILAISKALYGAFYLLASAKRRLLAAFKNIVVHVDFLSSRFCGRGHLQHQVNWARTGTGAMISRFL